MKEIIVNLSSIGTTYGLLVPIFFIMKELILSRIKFDFIMYLYVYLLIAPNFGVSVAEPIFLGPHIRIRIFQNWSDPDENG